MLCKFSALSLIILILSLFPYHAYCQNNLEILKDILERRIQQEETKNQREHELNMLRLESNHRMMLADLEHYRSRYSRMLNTYFEYLSLLEEYNINDLISIQDLLPNKESHSTYGLLEYYTNSIIILDTVNKTLETITIYLRRGYLHAGLIRDDLAIEYYEYYKSSEGNEEFTLFKEHFYKNNNMSGHLIDVPDDMLHYYIHGMEKKLLCREYYNKLKSHQEFMEHHKKISILYNEKSVLINKKIEYNERISQIMIKINDLEYSLSGLSGQYLIIQETKIERLRSDIDLLNYAIREVDYHISKIDEEISILKRQNR